MDHVALARLGEARERRRPGIGAQSGAEDSHCRQRGAIPGSPCSAPNRTPTTPSRPGVAREHVTAAYSAERLRQPVGRSPGAQLTRARQYFDSRRATIPFIDQGVPVRRWQRGQWQ